MNELGVGAHDSTSVGESSDSSSRRRMVFDVVLELLLQVSVANEGQRL